MRFEEECFETSALEKLMKLGGNKLVRRIITSFLENTPQRIEAAVEGHKAGNLNVLERSVHSIKSSAGQIGAARLRYVAEKIEQLSAEKRGSEIPSLLLELRESFGQVKSYFAEKTNLVGAKKIAIVEDNEDNRILVRAILEDLYDIMEYESGDEALKGFKKVRPDIILLDISLPEMDGIEILQKIRSDKDLRDMPVIALTAHAMEGSREKYLDAGFNDYVTKPIVDEVILLNAVEINIRKA